MRVVYLNKVAADSTLPAVNFSLFNGYGLAQAGATCELILQKRDAEFYHEDLLRQFDLPAQPQLKIHLLPRRRWLGFETNQWFYLEAMRRIKKLHKEAPVDAIISRDPGALPYLWRLRQKLKLSTFYQPHNFYADLSLRPDINRQNARKYHLLEIRYLPRLQGILCLLPAQAELYRRAFPQQNVWAAPPGLIKIAENQEGGFARKTLGYVGSLQLKKGVEDLLEAMTLLPADTCRLVLIGGRSEKEIAPVRERIQVLKLEDRVTLAGWLPYAQVLQHLSTISAGILPLRDTFYNRYLTAPNKFFDYISHGLPLLASDLPSLRGFMPGDQDALFFPAGEPAAMATSIQRLFEDRKTYDQYADASARLAQQFTWEKQGKAMLSYIAGEDTIA